MFNEPEKKTALPKGEVAYIKTLDDKVYFAVSDAQQNGQVDPSFVIAAYALDNGWPASAVCTTYKLKEAWKVAFKGIENLALSQSASLKLSESAAASWPSTAQFYQISLSGDAPPTEQALTTGDIFTPSKGGFFNIPRLYLMAALYLESKAKASVVALVTNAGGGIIATGLKYYGDMSGCGHAEVRALFSIKGLVPTHGALFSTLKPCTMCAGLIHALSDAGFRKYWARDDAGGAANWTRVAGLKLPSAHALSAKTQTDDKIRSLKLLDSRSFLDAFGIAWEQRGRLATPSATLYSQAFIDWRTARITKGSVIVKNARMQVRVRNIDNAAALASGCSTIKALSGSSTLFERCPPSSSKWVIGVDKAASEAIENAFTSSKQYNAVKSQVAAADREADMGIINFISAGRGSTSLREVARNTLAAKFAKYGKSADEIESVTGVKAATPSSTRDADPRMTEIGQYLFTFLKTQT